MTNGDRSGAAELSAARRYKEITGGLNAAVVQMKDTDRDRVQELRESLESLKNARTTSADRNEAIQAWVGELWELGVDEVWNESWMTPPLKPEADLTARPEELNYFETAVTQRLDGLRKAVHRRMLGHR